MDARSYAKWPSRSGAKWPFQLGQSLRKLRAMTASPDFHSASALAAPHRAVVQAALDRLSAELGVPVTAVECAVGDFTSVARGKSVGHRDFVGMTAAAL